MHIDAIQLILICASFLIIGYIIGIKHNPK